MKIFLILLTVIVTSCFYFPFEFTFLPGLNTKLMLSVVGIPTMAYHMIRLRTVVLSKEIVISSIIAILFSLIGLFSTDYNNTSDYSYATYIVSMWVWLSAAYTTCTLIALVHHKITTRLIINYLVAVCLMQVSLALIIDFNPTFKIFVDRYFSNGITEFLNKVKRLYGIGAALDVAGIRFSTVLIMISILISSDEKIRSNSKALAIYVISFVIIAAIGNMMSRTTSVGMGIGVVYLILTSKLFKNEIKVSNLRFWRVVSLSMAFVIAIATYLYNTNQDIYTLMRFGFEGFFNWVEIGEWRTDSTDKLNNEMWIWPDANDIKTWLIGQATFDDWFIVGTDIGYCRFVFYCGSIGLLTFTIFFAYLSYALWIKFPYFRNFFLMLFILTLINWVKVSTDLFVVYALFLSMGSPYIYIKYFKESSES